MIRTIQQRWQQFSPSDKRALMLGTLSLGLLFFWLLFWQPLQTQKQETQTRLDKLAADYAWMLQAAPQIKALQAAQTRKGNVGASLLTLIDQSLRQSSLASVNKRISPRDEHQAQVDFDAVEFNGFVTWLSTLLSTENIQVVYLSIEANKDAGMVQIRLSLRQSA